MDILKIKNADGSWTSIPAIQGPKGDKGDPGYVLTEQDKQDIAQIVLGLLPNGNEVKY